MNNDYTQSEQPVQQAKLKEEACKKCACCGGTMDFDPKTGGLLCPYCGCTEEIEPSGRAKELDFDSAAFKKNCSWGAEKKVVICKSCGASSVYDALDVASECPYCGSNQVMEEKGEDTLAPNGVCPFKVDKKQAGANFTSWLKGKLFCPNEAKKRAQPDAFKGVYLPYWTFDTQTYSHYTGRYGIDRTVRTSNGKSRKVTDWYDTDGTYSEFIDDQAVMASTRHDAGMLRSIEPFDTEHSVNYRPEYLTGFAAERYSVGLQEGWDHAKRDITSHLNSQVAHKIRVEYNADRVSSVDLRTVYHNVKYKYLMLPVWLSSFTYNGKVYQFMVNGQTGRVGGNSPVSPWKVAFAVLLGAAVIGAIWYFTQQPPAQY